MSTFSSTNFPASAPSIWRRSVALLAACLMCLIVPGPAWAADGSSVERLGFHALAGHSATEEGAESGTRVLVLPLRVSGSLSRNDRADLESKVIEGLRRADFEIVDAKNLSQLSARDLTCENTTCSRRLARTTKAHYLVRARVEVRDRDFIVRVRLLDGATGESVAENEGGCEICGLTEAESLVTSGAATLRTKLEALASGPTRLSLESQPRGAQVWIDGELIGTSPIETVVSPGTHLVKIAHPGYVAVEREMTFVRGVRESSSIVLAKQVRAKAPHAAWGWTALTLGVLGLGTGITFAALHGKDYQLDCDPTAGNRDSDGNCRFVWNSQWGGLGGAVAGAALASVGVVLIARRHKILSAQGRARSKALKETQKNRRRAVARRSIRDIQVRVGAGHVGLRGKF